tara:strand:+ start:381 stop:896 length:516 start_codon:yes stop_codon:yes gene_type:complete
MIYLNIGSNLESSYGNRFKNIELAINLMKNENIFVKKKSSFFETPSYPDFKKPKFINVCLEVEYENSPLLLLKSTLSIEKKVERIRREKNEPRTCDIDIIDFNNLVLDNKDIILPHPKAHIRNFVLYPLKELSPKWIHPVFNKNIDFFIKKLSNKTRNEITRLNENDILNK